MRSRLILEGNVQEVGFRAIVKQIALKAKIKGRVRNIVDEGTVEIYCEYRDLDQLNNFIESLRAIKAESGVKVDSIERFDEGSEQYGTVDESIFKGFSVNYGENLTDYEIGQAERSELTVLYELQMYSSMKNGFDNLGAKIDNGFDNLGKKIDNGFDNLGKKMDNGFDNLGKKIDNGFDNLGKKIDNVDNNLGTKIDSMHSDMNTRFDLLDKKYGLISQTMLKLLEQQQEHNKKLDEILNRLTKKAVKRK